MNAGPAAVLGNGSLLATVSERGRLERLFWPQLDRGSHLGELRLGLELDGETRWLDDASAQQSYLQEANVLLTGEATSSSSTSCTSSSLYCSAVSLPPAARLASSSTAVRSWTARRADSQRVSTTIALSSIAATLLSRSARRAQRHSRPVWEKPRAASRFRFAVTPSWRSPSAHLPAKPSRDSTPRFSRISTRSSRRGVGPVASPPRSSRRLLYRTSGRSIGAACSSSTCWRIAIPAP